MDNVGLHTKSRVAVKHDDTFHEWGVKRPAARVISTR